MMSCTPKKKNKTLVNVKEPVLPQKVVNEDLKIKSIGDFSDGDFDELAKSSELQGSVTFYLDGTLFEIISNGDLTYFPLGENLNIINIQNMYNNIFTIEEEWVESDLFSQKQLVYRANYNDSYVKLYDSKEEAVQLVSGVIKDSTIMISHGIHVGISKNDFFRKILGHDKEYCFAKIDTVRNRDELCEIEQCFVFTKDVLTKISFKSSYDWIPFD